MQYLFPDIAIIGNSFALASRADGLNTIIPSNIEFVQTGGYSDAGDGGNALFKKVAGPLVDGGSFQSLDGAWWELFTTVPNPFMFGATTAAANSAAAIQKCLDFATAKSLNTVDLVDYFKTTAAVNINSSMKFSGGGITTNGNTAVNVIADNVTITGVKFDSLNVGVNVDVAIAAANADRKNLTITGNKFGRVKLSIQSNGNYNMTGFVMMSNYFNGDYTNANYGDLVNVLDARAISDFKIALNTFDTIKAERILKLSCSTVYGNVVTGDFVSKRGVVVDNIFKSVTTSLKQVVDMYCSTTDIIIANNLVNSQGHETIFNCKPGANGNGEPLGNYNNIMVTNNNIVTTGNDVVSEIIIEGSWGFAWNVSPSKSQILNNNISRTGTNTGALIVSKGFEFSEVIGNNLYRSGTANFSVGISAFNNRVALVSANVINFGNIQGGGGSSNQSGTNYPSDPQIITITNNVLSDFASAGISVSGGAGCSMVTVNGNMIRNLVDSGSVSPSVVVSGLLVDMLVVTGNSSKMGSAGKQGLNTGGSTIGDTTNANNSWN